MSESRAGFALLVDVRVHPGQVERFERAILANARAAVRDEPECHAFHVTRVEGEPEHFVLFELYTSAESLAVHHASAHFQRFHQEAGDTIAEKSSQRLSLA